MNRREFIRNSLIVSAGTVVASPALFSAIPKKDVGGYKDEGGYPLSLKEREKEYIKELKERIADSLEKYRFELADELTRRSMRSDIDSILTVDKIRYDCILRNYQIQMYPETYDDWFNIYLSFDHTLKYYMLSMKFNMGMG